MLPLVIGAIYLGGPVFNAMIVMVAAILLWEWQGLVLCEQVIIRNLSILGTIALLTTSIFLPTSILGLLPFGLLIGLLVMERTKRYDTLLMAMGPVYVGVPCLALIHLRNDFGFALTVWCFAMVWATDIGGYAFGKTIGGAKLAPSVSPNKTWAGLLGGMFCSALVAMAGLWLDFFEVTYAASVFTLAALGACVALIAQAGDLFQSALKRRVGVKDSSHLIPGHGGVFDRVDGVLTAAPIVVLILMMMNSTGAVH